MKRVHSEIQQPSPFTQDPQRPRLERTAPQRPERKIPFELDEKEERFVNPFSTSPFLPPSMPGSSSYLSPIREDSELTYQLDEARMIQESMEVRNLDKNNFIKDLQTYYCDTSATPKPDQKSFENRLHLLDRSCFRQLKPILEKILDARTVNEVDKKLFHTIFYFDFSRANDEYILDFLRSASTIKFFCEKFKRVFFLLPEQWVKRNHSYSDSLDKSMCKAYFDYLHKKCIQNEDFVLEPHQQHFIALHLKSRRLKNCYLTTSKNFMKAIEEYLTMDRNTFSIGEKTQFNKNIQEINKAITEKLEKMLDEKTFSIKPKGKFLPLIKMYDRVFLQIKEEFIDNKKLKILWLVSPYSEKKRLEGFDYHMLCDLNPADRDDLIKNFSKKMTSLPPVLSDQAILINFIKMSFLVFAVKHLPLNKELDVSKHPLLIQFVQKLLTIKTFEFLKPSIITRALNLNIPIHLPTRTVEEMLKDRPLSALESFSLAAGVQSLMPEMREQEISDVGLCELDPEILKQPCKIPDAKDVDEKSFKTLCDEAFKSAKKLNAQNPRDARAYALIKRNIDTHLTTYLKKIFTDEKHTDYLKLRFLYAHIFSKNVDVLGEFLRELSHITLEQAQAAREGDTFSITCEVGLRSAIQNYYTLYAGTSLRLSSSPIAETLAIVKEKLLHKVYAEVQIFKIDESAHGQNAINFLIAPYLGYEEIYPFDLQSAHWNTVAIKSLRSIVGYKLDSPVFWREAFAERLFSAATPRYLSDMFRETAGNEGHRFSSCFSKEELESGKFYEEDSLTLTRAGAAKVLIYYKLLKLIPV